MEVIPITNRAARKMVQAFARSLHQGSWLKVEPEEWYRVDGRLVCSWCGYECSDHPDNGTSTFVTMCNGQVVKV